MPIPNITWTHLDDVQLSKISVATLRHGEFHEYDGAVKWSAYPKKGVETRMDGTLLSTVSWLDNLARPRTKPVMKCAWIPTAHSRRETIACYQHDLGGVAKRHYTYVLVRRALGSPNQSIVVVGG